jgi:hypothetical protein
LCVCQAKSRFERRAAEEERARERGDDKWMLPSVEERLAEESGKKSKKHKKEKKHKKKSKKEKRRANSSVRFCFSNTILCLLSFVFRRVMAAASLATNGSRKEVNELRRKQKWPARLNQQPEMIG